MTRVTPGEKGFVWVDAQKVGSEVVLTLFSSTGKLLRKQKFSNMASARGAAKIATNKLRNQGYDIKVGRPF